MKTVCILLASSIKNDSRVIKTMQTLSQHFIIHLYHVDDTSEEFDYFNENVVLFRIPSKKETFKRKVISHSFFYRSFIHLKDEVLNSGIKYEIVFANDLPTLLPAVQLSQVLNSKLIYDSHEIYCETLNQFFPSKVSPFKKPLFSILLKLMKYLGKKKEHVLIQEADELITVNESLLEYFKKEYRITNGHVIMNLPFARVKDLKKVDYRKMYNWPSDANVFIYQGILNKGRGLKLIVEAIYKSENINKLVIVGHGNMLNELKTLSKEFNTTDKIKFVGRIPLEALPSYTSGADAGFNILEDLNLSKKLASPNKLFEYIHSGIPVICTESIENNKVLNKYTVGVTVDNNVDAIVEGMSKAIKMKNNSSVHSELKECAEHYTWQRQEHSLLDLVKS